MNERVVLRPIKVSSRPPSVQLPPPQKKKKKKSRLWKGLLVVLFSTGLTTLAIYASDNFRNPDSLIAGVGGAGKNAEHCPPEMAYIPTDGGYCIDKYEVSTGESCQRRDPANEFETKINLTDTQCMPASQKGSRPWVNVPLHEALAVCAKAGKRLPTNKEWYRASLGTPDIVAPEDQTACALGKTGQSQSDAGGTHSRCVSSYGVYDMVGNVWEWVDGQIENGRYGQRELPGEGYVDEVDVDGVASKVATSSNQVFGEDYLYIDRSGIRGMIRGGFWSLKEKAGIFNINATIPTSFVGNAVGFRCAKDAK